MLKTLKRGKNKKSKKKRFSHLWFSCHADSQSSKWKPLDSESDSTGQT